MTDKLDCGHANLNGPVNGTGAAGYAVTPDGSKICYECSNKAEADAFATADAYTGYVTVKRDQYVSARKPAQFTTWPGGKLADVTSLTFGPRRLTPTGGDYRMRYVKAVAPDGSRWHGRGSDNFDVITLHRSAVRGERVTVCPAGHVHCESGWHRP